MSRWLAWFRIWADGSSVFLRQFWLLGLIWLIAIAADLSLRIATDVSLDEAVFEFNTGRVNVLAERMSDAAYEKYQRKLHSYDMPIEALNDAVLDESPKDISDDPLSDNPVPGLILLAIYRTNKIFAVFYSDGNGSAEKGYIKVRVGDSLGNLRVTSISAFEVRVVDNAGALFKLSIFKGRGDE